MKELQEKLLCLRHRKYSVVHNHVEETIKNI